MWTPVEKRYALLYLDVSIENIIVIVVVFTLINIIVLKFVELLLW